MLLFYTVTTSAVKSDRSREPWSLDVQENKQPVKSASGRHGKEPHDNIVELPSEAMTFFMQLDVEVYCGKPLAAGITAAPSLGTARIPILSDVRTDQPWQKTHD
jgi:hypothetical protein